MEKRNLLNALTNFLKGTVSDETELLDRIRKTAFEVPAYRAFLSSHGLMPESVLTIRWSDLPIMTKQNYVSNYSLADRCIFGALSEADTFAISSGTTGTPTIWPRSLIDELDASFPYEFVIHHFEADRRPTLVVVTFPLGNWIGGMHSISTLRLLAAKGFPIAVIPPGANLEEIGRAAVLAVHFEQIILVGYPPFVRDVLASNLQHGTWAALQPRLILAGESFTEEWRDQVHKLAGRENPTDSSASIYGTADAGVLAFETAESIQVRRLASKSPSLCEQLFAQSRVPALMQYSAAHIHFEEHGGELHFSKLGTMPLIRYNLGDSGGIYKATEMAALLRGLVSSGESSHRDLISRIDRSPYPFVYLFGRTDSTVSFFGANVYAEHISTAINKSPIADQLTGRFYMETSDGPTGEKNLRVIIETHPDTILDDGKSEALRRHIEETLRDLNSEFKNYVPSDRQRLEVKLIAFGSDARFSRKGKQRYSNSHTKS